MRRFLLPALLAILLAGWGLDCLAATLHPGWLERAPLNTDTDLLGFDSAIGLARGWRYLAYLFNLVALAGLTYAIARDEAEFSWFLYAYLGSILGGILLSFALSPFIGAFALLPIVLLTAGLLYWLCGVSVGRALLIGAAYHICQILSIILFKLIESRMTASA